MNYHAIAQLNAYERGAIEATVKVITHYYEITDSNIPLKDYAKQVLTDMGWQEEAIQNVMDEFFKE